MEIGQAMETDRSRAPRLIRLKEVKHRTGLSTATVYRRMKEGTFPQSHSLGGSMVAWSEAEIEDWIFAALRS